MRFEEELCSSKGRRQEILQTAKRIGLPKTVAIWTAIVLGDSRMFDLVLKHGFLGCRGDIWAQDLEPMFAGQYRTRHRLCRWFRGTVKGEDKPQKRSFLALIRASERAETAFVEGQHIQALMENAFPLASDISIVDFGWLAQMKQMAKTGSTLDARDIVWQKEQACKMYGTSSPLLYLASLGFAFEQRAHVHACFFYGTRGEGSVPTAAKLVKKNQTAGLYDGVVADAEPAPLCSLYGVHKEFLTGYALTVDIDVENKNGYMSTHKLTRDECRRRFEGEDGGHLQAIAKRIKTIFAELHPLHPEPCVGWHRSTGSKVSYRGYVIGPFWNSLSGPAELMTYVEQALETESEWYVKGTVDMCEYQAARLVRLLGSAKLNLRSEKQDEERDKRAIGKNMRPLQLEPMPCSDPGARDMFAGSPNWYIGRAVGIFCAPEHLRGELPTLLSTRELDSNDADVIWDGVPVLDVRSSDNQGGKRKRWSGAKPAPPTALVGVRVPTDWREIQEDGVNMPAYVQIYARRLEPLLEKRFGHRAEGWRAVHFAFNHDSRWLKLGDFSHGLCVSKKTPPQNHTTGREKTWFEINIFTGFVQCCCYKCGFIGREAQAVGTIRVKNVVVPGKRDAVEEAEAGERIAEIERSSSRENIQHILKDLEVM